MSTRLTEEYYVMRQGEIQEEPVSRADLEAMCRSGALTAGCQIFDPEHGVWRRLGETEFVYILEAVGEGCGEDASVGTAQRDTLLEAYKRARERVQEAPQDWKSHFAAAEIAASLDDGERTRRHFRDALALSPYNPRVAAAVKRTFPPGEWKTFRRLQRVAPVWDDMMRIVLYPFERGPVRVIVPGLILGALSSLPLGNLLAAALAYAWAGLAAHGAAWGESPTVWSSLRRTFRHGGGGALLAMTVATAEVCAPFLVIAQIGAWLDPLGAAHAFAYIAGSPILTVAMVTAGLLYLPAVIICAVLPDRRIADVANPAHVIRAIRAMEVEYVMAAGFAAAWFCLWSALRAALGVIPFAGDIITGLVGAYGLLATMFVLGRMTVRHREEIDYHDGRLPAVSVPENPLDPE